MFHHINNCNISHRAVTSYSHTNRVIVCYYSFITIIVLFYYFTGSDCIVALPVDVVSSSGGFYRHLSLILGDVRCLLGLLVVLRSQNKPNFTEHPPPPPPFITEQPPPNW